MKIVVVGLGYVGLSLAVLLAQKNEVKAYDVVKSKVDMINKRVSPINDKYITEYLNKTEISIDARNNADGLYEWADFVIISTPTNYDEETNYFDTSSIEKVVEEIKNKNDNASIVIKSTIPIGYTRRIKKQFDLDCLFFSPEFLREGKALEDNLYPSRIIVGVTDDSKESVEKANIFADMLNECAIKKTTTIIMKSEEAESVKLFANSFLAMRVAFFNELDTFADINGFDSSKIIHGMCSDARIGDFYNNPSFGYGGYCLPKDTKQLNAEFKDAPNNMVKSTIKANDDRAEYIANKIIKLAIEKSDNPVVGVYRLVMKAGSDNYRSSAVHNVMSILNNNKIKVVIYEPTYSNESYNGFDVINDFDAFVNKSTIVIANRKDDRLNNLPSGKLFSRDIYGQN